MGLAPALLQPEQPLLSLVPGRSTVYAPTGAVATSHPLATAEGLRVLQSGGNAVDAAVAAAAVQAVVEPNMTGPGGDAFAQVWWAPEARLYALDASGRTGSGATPEALARAGGGKMPERGPATVSVPGAVSGWAALLDRFGTWTLDRALETATDLARGGFPVSPLIARRWADDAPVLARDPGAAATFLHQGRPPAAGEWHRNPDMARSLELLARHGPDALYGGELGARLVDGLAAMGGLLTVDDLARHRPRWVDPISCSFMGHTVWELPPAGQGIAVLQMLSVLEGLDLEAMGFNSADYLHHLAEAKKLAFADLAGHVADADHMRVTPDRMLHPPAVAQRRSRIDPARASASPPPGDYGGRETIYLAVGDGDGNLVSFINSIYWSFGSGVVVPGTGFALQNRGGAHVLDEGHPNRVAPGKRTLHTIIPAMLTRDGQAVMALGVVGRSMQPQGQVQVLLNHLLWGMDLQTSVDAPRFRHTEGADLALEPCFGAPVREELARRGHRLIPETDVFFGSAQVVKRLARGWAAASDPRRDGGAGGY